MGVVQVGLISINLMGRPLDGAQPAPSQPTSTGSVLAPVHPNRPMPARDGPLPKPPGMAPPGETVDALTAARMRELTAAKERAVAAEDYDEAKRLKLAVDALRALGTQIAVLEARCGSFSLQ